MYPAINIGSLVFPTAGLIYLVGAWISLSVVERAAKRLNQDPEPIYGIAATALFAGLVGARLTFVIIYWSAFRDNLLGILWPLNSGYNLWGGLIIGVAAAVFYGRAKQLSPAETLDSLAPGLLLGFMFISLADFLAGPGFGTLTRVPWAITQYSMRRHPVQIYEIVVGLAALLAWWRMRPHRLFAGQLFLLVVSIYSGGRLFIDAFRENAWLASNGLHILQIICLLLMLVALYLLGHYTDRAIQ
jgi:phosphatidylglycerol:prolipoprotein diacylglycerol transferase